MRLGLNEKLHMIHRCWRLRFKSEVPSIHYVRTAALAGATVLDIGANKGVFSIYMSRAAGPDGQLFAFEAQPELGYAGRFLHVTEADHHSLLHKGRSEYVPCERRHDYPHVHPSVHHRNYLFEKKSESMD